MRFDNIIIGGGLAGLIAGIRLQQEGRSTAIVSTGQNALHFFSGSFESLTEAPEGMCAVFDAAGIPLHYRPGVRLMPLGSFREAALSLGDVSLLPEAAFARKALVVGFTGYGDFFPDFLAEGLRKAGVPCRTELLQLPELELFQLSPSEMRSIQIARALDRSLDSFVRRVKALLTDEDCVILPQVFGLKDPAVPERLREALGVRVVYVGTLPPSVPGIRTQGLLKRCFERLGGTSLMGDEVLRAHLHDGVVHSVVTRNLDSHYLEADRFVLATGAFYGKGLQSHPEGIRESVFGLDVDYDPERKAWYDPSFAAEQPYMRFGVRTDASLHGLLDGKPVKNLYVAGSVLGGTRPEFGSAAGLAVRSALAVVEAILQS